MAEIFCYKEPQREKLVWVRKKSDNRLIAEYPDAKAGQLIQLPESKAVIYFHDELVEAADGYDVPREIQERSARRVELTACRRDNQDNLHRDLNAQRERDGVWCIILSPIVIEAMPGIQPGSRVKLLRSEVRQLEGAGQATVENKSISLADPDLSRQPVGTFHFFGEGQDRLHFEHKASPYSYQA